MPLKQLQLQLQLLHLGFKHRIEIIRKEEIQTMIVERQGRITITATATTTGGLNIDQRSIEKETGNHINKQTSN